MSGTKQNIGIAELRKAFHQKFGNNYHIKGSYPYDKGTEVWKKGTHMHPAYVLQTFDKNWDLYCALRHHPDYHPEKQWPLSNLFGKEEKVIFNTRQHQNSINNALNNWAVLRERLELYGIPFHEGKKIYEQLLKLKQASV